MTRTLDLQVFGEVASCRSAVLKGEKAVTAIGDAVSDLDKARGDSSSWIGSAAEGYRGQVQRTRSDLTDLKTLVTDTTKALDAFADELVVVKDKMGDTRDYASKRGLSVAGQTVTAPAEPDQGAENTVLEAYNVKVGHWNTAVEMADAARNMESNAHDKLTSAMKQANGDGWVENVLEKLGFAPPDMIDGVAGTGWMLGLGLTGLGLQVDAMSRAVLGRWQPWVKDANGRWKLGSPYGHSPLERFKMGLRSGQVGARDWRAQPYQSAARSKWGSAGKWAGRAGLGLTAITSGWEQWKADSDDPPSLDTGERVDRTATKAAASTAGAWAGAQGGAWVGGAIGTAVFPGVGTVIGGAVGGIVGGVGGAMAGGAVGDYVNEQWDGAGHAVGDLGGSIGDVASDVGDKISFWD